MGAKFFWDYFFTHLLEANFERAHPAWSMPPFKKKSTCPTGMDIPKSSKQLFIKSVMTMTTEAVAYL